jgi:hypothetical protein
MDSTRNTGSGKPSAFPPSRTRANDSGSEEDDCIVLEVLDPTPISYAFFAIPVLADPDRQVLENMVPLSANPGAPLASRTRKTPATDSAPGAAQPTKRRKVPGAGPSRERKKKAIPTSTG